MDWLIAHGYIWHLDYFPLCILGFWILSGVRELLLDNECGTRNIHCLQTPKWTCCDSKGVEISIKHFICFLYPFQISQILRKGSEMLLFPVTPETLDHCNSYCHSPFPHKNAYFSQATLLHFPCLLGWLSTAVGHILFMDCPCKVVKWPANYNYISINTFCQFCCKRYWFT